MPHADDLIGTDTALVLLHAVHLACPDLPLPALRAAATSPSSPLTGLRLRERSDLLRDALLSDLDGTYWDLAQAVRRAVEGRADFAGWLIWPVTSAVAERAVADGSSTAFDDALQLLAGLTSRLSSEFALRTLLRHDLTRALAVIESDWVLSPDVHVRRLASEGTRPYLPWATRVPEITAHPAVTVPVLNALYRDESEYVRRSVANHLNDLSREHPDLVVDVARTWLGEPDTTTERLVARAPRTLVKRGHPQALALQGFPPATLEVSELHLDHDVVPLGEALTFAATITNLGSQPARLSIDYVVHHRGAGGGSRSKTFKLAVRTLAPGEDVRVSKTHSFRVITTRRYYPGPQAVELLINGMPTGRRTFTLTPTAEEVTP